MKRRGSGLAARFQRAVSAESEQRTEAAREAERRLAEDREERDRLFEDLAALGHDLPIDGVERSETQVRFTNADHTLVFSHGPDATVLIDFAGRRSDDTQTVFRQHELGGRWIWKRVRRGKEDRLPLFDQALEILLVHALGLPEPEQADRTGQTGAPAPSPAQGTQDADRPSTSRGKRL